MTGVPSPSDRDSPDRLVARAIHGDEAAFARIVRLHHEEMVRACYVVTGDLDLAERAVAVAWPVAWHRLRRLREPERLRAWLCELALERAGVLARSRDRAIDTPTDPRVLATLPAVMGIDGAALVRAYATPTASERPRARPPMRRRSTPRGEPSGAEDTNRGDGPSPDPSFRSSFERRLEALAEVPVRPVDIDAVAHAAKAEQLAVQGLIVSVVIAAILALAFFVFVYGNAESSRQEVPRVAPSSLARPVTLADAALPMWAPADGTNRVTQSP